MNMPDLFCLRCGAPAETEELFSGTGIRCTQCAAREVRGVRNAVCEGFGSAKDLEALRKKAKKVLEQEKNITQTRPGESVIHGQDAANAPIQGGGVGGNADGSAPRAREVQQTIAEPTGVAGSSPAPGRKKSVFRKNRKTQIDTKDSGRIEGTQSACGHQCSSLDDNERVSDLDGRSFCACGCGEQLPEGAHGNTRYVNRTHRTRARMRDYRNKHREQMAQYYRDYRAKRAETRGNRV